MPQSGYSAAARLLYRAAVLLDISKSQDATVAIDVETDARLGLLAEYRYALSKTSRGAFAGGYWNESIRSSKAPTFWSRRRDRRRTPPVNRWLVLGRATHR